MATVSFNSITKGFGGSIGNLVFRQVRGKTIVTGKPRAPKKQSEQQRTNRLKFKQASRWAKATVNDPEKKAYYLRMAKKLKLPNAYTAAISDYMRKGEIKEIDTRSYKGNTGDVIRIKTHKKDFAVRNVKLTLYNTTENIIESGSAVFKNGFFIYKASNTLAEKSSVTVKATLPDHPWNEVQREIVIDMNS